MTGAAEASTRPVQVQRSLTVGAPRGDLFRRWREPETQRVIWSHVAEITGETEETAHWRVAAPLGRTLEWDARIVEEREPELLRWEARGDISSAGTIEFRDAPGELGTEITVRVSFDPPGGVVGRSAARPFDDPPKLVLAKALRRFKSLVETGEIPSTERNPSARAA